MLKELETLRRPGASIAMAHQIKAARVVRDLTLADLAATVSLDKGYLSKVERGLKVPSIATLLKLAKALSVPVSQLFGDSIDESVIHVSRGALRKGPVGGDGAGYRTEALTSGQGREGLEGFVFFPPEEFLDDMRAEHGGEELLYVISGSVEIHFADRTLALDASDSVQFPGHLQHQVRRTSPEASVLVVITRA
jgi:transcriptional regulator with XRE-family HTH domain